MRQSRERFGRRDSTTSMCTVREVEGKVELHARESGSSRVSQASEAVGVEQLVKLHERNWSDGSGLRLRESEHQEPSLTRPRLWHPAGFRGMLRNVPSVPDFPRV